MGAPPGANGTGKGGQCSGRKGGQKGKGYKGGGKEGGKKGGDRGAAGKGGKGRERNENYRRINWLPPLCDPDLNTTTLVNPCSGPVQEYAFQRLPDPPMKHRGWWEERMALRRAELREQNRSLVPPQPPVTIEIATGDEPTEIGVVGTPAALAVDEHMWGPEVATSHCFFYARPEVAKDISILHELADDRD